VLKRPPDLIAAPPPRGIVRAPRPDGLIDGRRVLPPPRLAPFVHHFWWVRWALRTPFAPEVLAHPAAQIVFEEEDGTRRARINGVATARTSRCRAGKGSVFGITFRPAMFQPLLRAPMTSITDRVVDIGEVLGPKANEWARATYATRDLARKIAIADAFLAPLLVPARPEVTRVRDLVERMWRDRAMVRVDDVCAAADLDPRALQRSFRTYVGVTPKWVIRRYRLHEAAEQLKAPRPPSLAALAASLGYADQSHFAREFKVVIGRTPAAFVRLSRSEA
jgi:AraC-like DNA-binding protein